MNSKSAVAWCAVVATTACSAVASFPIGQTVAAGGRDDVFRITAGDGGQGTLNLFGNVFNDGNQLRMCFITANHVVAGTNVASIDYRGIGHAGTFNAAPSAQIIQQLGGEDIVFVGLSFNRAAIGNANFATLAALTPLTIAADAGGNHTFQEWGYGISATPDTINGTPYPFVYHTANAGEQYGVLRTFSNTLTANTARTTGGVNIRDLTWVVGGAAMANLGSGAPGDSGAGLSDLAGPATTISGILTGGTDTRFNAAGTVVTNNTYNRIAWSNTDSGFGLGFTNQVVTTLAGDCGAWVPAPGALSLGLVGMLLAGRRRRA